MPLVSLANPGRSVKGISGSAQNLRLLEHIPINYSDFCYNADKSRVIVVVFTATFNNNISVISWRLVLLVKETGVSKENHRPVASD